MNESSDDATLDQQLSTPISTRRTRASLAFQTPTTPTRSTRSTVKKQTTIEKLELKRSIDKDLSSRVKKCMRFDENKEPSLNDNVDMTPSKRRTRSDDYKEKSSVKNENKESSLNDNVDMTPSKRKTRSDDNKEKSSIKNDSLKPRIGIVIRKGATGLNVKNLAENDSLRCTPKRRSRLESEDLSLDEEESSFDNSKENDDLVQEAGDYFLERSMKVKRSTNTLKELDFTMLKNIGKNVEDKKVMELLIEYHGKEFRMFYGLLVENFNVILYGLGSKKSLLDAFKDRWLLDEKYLKIHGFFTELNLRHILIKLSSFFGLESTANEDAFYTAADELEDEIYLVIHSIDILIKNDPKIKTFLINLYVKCDGKLHIIATVDQINAALMFDLKEEQQLNLVCLEATTYESCKLEICYINSSKSKRDKKGLLGLDMQTQALNRIHSVYNTLSANSRSILVLLFTEWLKSEEFKRQTKNTTNDDDDKCLTFKQMSYKSREQFLAVSDRAFRHQITEFKDHDIIKVFKSKGTEYISVLIESHIIQMFLNDKDRSNL